jgi:SNF2 family DNA or RNA helicase|nr:MAG TPA: Chromatin remodeling complex ATPase [Caudoviricetes sp.]
MGYSKLKNQQLAFDKLSRLKVGALFMEMGTGKTKVALDLINSKSNKIDYILWICPFSIKNEIIKERDKWYPAMKIDVVGCETIGSSDRTYLEILKRVTTSKTFIVVDESLKIKNINAKRTRRIIEFGGYAQYKLILNGTPITKNVIDLWAQMEFLSPKILKMSFNQFKNTYCEYYIRGRLKGMVKKQRNIEHLISLIEPYIFDCDLDIEAKKMYYNYFYDVDIFQYSSLKNELLECITNIDFFVLTTKLQQFYTTYKEEMLKELLGQINDKVIIFVKYLDSIPAGANKIVGDMNTKERKQVIDKFERGDFKELYITYGCGSYGLNLQFCRNIIFAEHCFDYSQRIQAEARIYRIGQNYDVNYYNLWCNVGLEKMIQSSLNKKSNLLNEIKKEIDKKGENNLKKLL